MGLVDRSWAEHDRRNPRRRNPRGVGAIRYAHLVAAAIQFADHNREAIGHGASTELSAADAIAIAAAAEPEAAGANLLVDSAFQDDHDIPLGTRVTVTPESFGTEATEGELVAATRTHYSLRREDPRAGVVHVHFPRIGYMLRAAS